MFSDWRKGCIFFNRQEYNNEHTVERHVFKFFYLVCSNTIRIEEFPFLFISVLSSISVACVHYIGVDF